MASAPPPAVEPNRPPAEHTDNARVSMRWRPPDNDDVTARDEANLRHRLLKGKQSPLIYSTLVMPLNAVCTNDLLRDELEQRAVALQQIRVEAWNVANLHCTRLFENHRLLYPDYPDTPARSRVLESVLKLDAKFFYRCCTGVYENDGGREPLTSSNEPLETTIADYVRHRDRVDSHLPAKLSHVSDDLHALAVEMTTATANHINCNFENRLKRYTALRLGISAKEASKMVSRIKTPRIQHTALDLEWLAWLEMPPTARNIKAHPVLFLGKLYDMLSILEPMLEETPVPKGCTVFTLLPQTTSCVPSYYTINTSILYNIAKRIIKRHGEDVFGLCKSDDGLGRQIFATTGEFQSVRERMWKSGFVLTACESSDESPSVDPRIGRGRRKFEFQIKTNGYAVCVLTSIPRATQCAPPTPGQYKPHTLIGIDPGQRMPFTAYCLPIPGTYCNLPELPCPMPGWCSACYGHNGGKRYGKKRRRGQQRRRRRRKRRSRAVCDVEGWCDICQKTQHKIHPRKHGVRRRLRFLRDGSHIQQASSREYRHMARIEHHAHWFENLKKRYPGYGSFIKDMPSFKTASSARLLEGYQYMWRNINSMREFCAMKGFRKWRFTISRFKRVAVCKLAKRIVPIIDRDVCICLGDWNRQKGLSGHMNAPLRRIAAELSRRATVVYVDEFRTSRLCSDCFTPMVGMPFADPVTTEVKPSRNVRLCENGLCTATCWERDVNAAKNMWQLGLLQVLGRPRTLQFRRGRRLP